MMTDGIEAYILFCHYEIQLRVRADPYETVPRERERGGVELSAVGCAA